MGVTFIQRSALVIVAVVELPRCVSASMTDPTSLSNLSEAEEVDTDDTDDFPSTLSATMADDTPLQQPHHPTPFLSSSLFPSHKRPRPNPIPHPPPPTPLDPNHPLTLDIGGTLFRTTPFTLLSTPISFFSALLSSPSFTPHPPPFIDRDPYHFRLILNFLRGAGPPRGLSHAHLMEVRTEADFYHLTDLVTALDAQILTRQMRKTNPPPTPHLPQLQHRTRSTPLTAAGSTLAVAEDLEFNAEF